MTAPSLDTPWVLIRNGKAPPALARITRERWGESFYGELMVVEMNQTSGVLEYRKRRDYGIIINNYENEILHVFPCAPSAAWVAEARRALRRKTKTEPATSSVLPVKSDEVQP
jgi:hypothetical protein